MQCDSFCSLLFCSHARDIVLPGPIGSKAMSSCAIMDNTPYRRFIRIPHLPNIYIYVPPGSFTHRSLCSFISGSPPQSLTVPPSDWTDRHLNLSLFDPRIGSKDASLEHHQTSQVGSNYHLSSPIKLLAARSISILQTHLTIMIDPDHSDHQLNLGPLDPRFEG